MVLDGEKLPELDEVDLETIFNEVKSEDSGASRRCLGGEKVTGR